MGRASSSKKVARASKVAGRANTRSSNLVWPAAVAGVVILGVLLVAISRGTNSIDAGSGPSLGGEDHWHAAYGVYDCDKFLAPFGDEGEDEHGMHTHQDGLIHIHPFDTGAVGKNANLQTFADQVGMELEDDRIELPGGTVRKNGDKCGDKAANVELWSWDNPADDTPKQVKGDLAKFRPKDQSMVVLAFVPKGTEVPRPTSAVNLNDPLAAEEGRPTAAEGAGATPSTVPATTDTTPTTAPGATTATTAK